MEVHIDTAKLNGLDPEAYLRDALNRIVDHKINRVAELLPWNWGLHRVSMRSQTVLAPSLFSIRVLTNVLK
jgi:hypothetical protein